MTITMNTTAKVNIVCSTTFPMECDYLIVGAGATGMAFCDSLIEGNNTKKQMQQQQRPSSELPSALSIVMVDTHCMPGGHWMDSYGFVQLHQPSAMYGVESTLLEANNGQDHRATRDEILDYYASLVERWTQSKDVNFTFVGNVFCDVDQEPGLSKEYPIIKTYTIILQINNNTQQHRTLNVLKRLVDARFLQPDIPINNPPRFEYDPNRIRCVPVNGISDAEINNDEHFFVVIGAGKTGMDAMMYLLTQHQIPPSHLVWIAPHNAWITARENVGNCMEFVADTTTLYSRRNEVDGNSKLNDVQLVQETFLKWEMEGKIYRLFEDENNLPTKFNDATLSKDELQVLRSLPSSQLILKKGRVQRIDSNTGALYNEHGNCILDLPFDLQKTTYVHCSAGAFHYSKLNGVQQRPVFEQHRITCQDVYGTPGFCFVGSILGKLESIETLQDSDRNRLCRVPPPPPLGNNDNLGPSGGTVGGLSKNHKLVQRLLNLRGWLAVPELRQWLVGHRLFNLNHISTAEDMEALVDRTYSILHMEGLA